MLCAQHVGTPTLLVDLAHLPPAGRGEGAAQPIPTVPAHNGLGGEAEADLHSGHSRRVHISERCASEVSGMGRGLHITRVMCSGSQATRTNVILYTHAFGTMIELG